MNCDKYGVDLERFQKIANCYTREEIAKGVGCDTSTVTKHYNGDRPINLDFAIRYAKFFNVSLDYLVRLSNEKMNVVSDEEVFKRNMVDYSGFSLETIEKMREILTELLLTGTAVEDELLSYAEFYSKFLYYLIDNRDFLWNIFQISLNYESAIKKEEQINKILTADILTVDLFPTFISPVDLFFPYDRLKSNDTFSVEYKQYLIIKSFKNALDKFFSKEQNYYFTLSESNREKIKNLSEERKKQIIEFYNKAADKSFTYETLLNLFKMDGEPNGNDTET